jgi:predicted metal-dependent enzyme (double-stranded beta helix superfamily)
VSTAGAYGFGVDLDALFADLADAVREDAPQLAVRDVLQRAVERRSELAAALPCERAEFVPLVSTPEITIIKTVWAPGMHVPPHDHRMGGAIAVFTGKEDNQYWRRAGGGIERSGGKELAAGDVGLMGTDLIHSVTAPLTREWTGAIHVYGGDFVAQERSMWIDGVEEPSDAARTAAIFEAANLDRQER